MGFIAFGVLNGIGAVIAQVYGDVLKAVLGRAGWQRYLKNPAIHCGACIVTFHYVCFCLLFFSTGIDVRVSFCTRQEGSSPPCRRRSRWCAGIPAPSAIAVPCTVLTALLQLDRFKSLATRFSSANASLTSMYWMVATKTIVVVLLFCFRWAYQQDPPQVLYMRF